jgi:signal transduction histidine kinase
VAPGAAPVAVQTLHTLVELLGEVDVEAPSAGFWNRLCTAGCRMSGTSRALVFSYDEPLREVRAVGAHGLDPHLFADVHVNMSPLARRALETDQVLVVDAAREDGLPARYVELLGLRTVVCTPMSAGGTWYGVLLVDRGSEPFAPDEGQLEALWTLGKVAALAVAARVATRQQERARALADRIDLARDVHDGVVQRLFGVTMALSTHGPLEDDLRERCRVELQGALDELRTAMQRPLGRRAAETGRSLLGEVHRLGREHGVALAEGAEVDVPPAVEPLALSVVLEAVRNARKHADAGIIDVHLRRRDGAFVVEVVNDGVPPGARAPGGGMGLRLAAFEALHQGGVLEYGPRGVDRWHVRLTVPVRDQR